MKGMSLSPKQRAERREWLARTSSYVAPTAEEKRFSEKARAVLARIRKARRIGGGA